MKYCYKLATDLRLIMGDRIQLQQVLLNLIINGIEAMSVASGPARALDNFGESERSARIGEAHTIRRHNIQ